MSLIVDENFGGYAPGFVFEPAPGPPYINPANPGQWYGTTGPANIRAGQYGSATGVMPPNNYAPPATQSCALGSIDMFLPVPLPVTGGVISLSYIFTGTSNGARGSMVYGNCYQVSVGPPAMPPPPPPFDGYLFSIAIEDDCSVSLYCRLGIMVDPVTMKDANSMIQNNMVINPNVWNYIQINFRFSASDDVVPLAIVGLNLSVNGEFFVLGTGNTGVLYSLAPGINSWGFSSAFGFESQVTNITLDDSPTAGYPYPATPPLPLARASQLPMQYLKNPNYENARVSQNLLQFLKHPNYENARVSQIVIQVLGNRQSGGGGGTGGWKVKEA